MWFKSHLLLVASLIYFVNCNFTRNYEDSKYKTRHSRLLSFNTDERGDVSVELAFNVPFLKIPVKRGVDSVKGAVANINVGAIALSGGLIFAAVGLLPAISWLMTKKTHGEHYTYRTDDGGHLFDDFLIQRNMECLQKALCWTVKRSRKRVENGKGSSGDKIIDGLASSEWLRFIVDGTMLRGALENGIQGSNCAKEYSTCKISKSDLEWFANDVFGDN